MNSTLYIDLPGHVHAIANLSSAFGPERAIELWKEACLLSGVEDDSTNPDDLNLVYRYLADQDGIVGVFGSSLLLRLKAYKKLLNYKTDTP